MKPITLFDILKNEVLWQCEFCSWCDLELQIDDEGDHEIVIRAYRGQHGHLCLIGYHPQCYIEKSKYTINFLDG